jgi:hypothetical protein
MAEERKLYNEELHDFFSSPDIRVIKSNIMRWTDHVACIGEKNSYWVVVGKLEGKRPLRRLRQRWEDNVKTDLKETGREGFY